MSSPHPTIPIYHHDGQLTQHTTKITSTQPYTALPEPSRQIFKQFISPDSSSTADDHHVLTTTSTIFHPQGGGQPSDTGEITSTSPSTSTTFTVTNVRHDALSPTQILHLGTYTNSTSPFRPNDPVIQTINASQRHHFSRLHTAGHLLGLAVRDHLTSTSPTDAGTINDGKASHFPGKANVEFIGLIDSKHKAGIQAKLDEYIAAKIPVEIHEWDETELRDPVNKVYMAENSMAVGGGEGGSLRCVSVRGVGAYPCGGTHVRDTGECGRVNVYKIGRAKGVTKVSYSLD